MFPANMAAESAAQVTYLYANQSLKKENMYRPILRSYFEITIRIMFFLCWSFTPLFYTGIQYSCLRFIQLQYFSPITNNLRLRQDLGHFGAIPRVLVSLFLTLGIWVTCARWSEKLCQALSSETSKSLTYSLSYYYLTIYFHLTFQLFVRLGGKQTLDGLDKILFADIPDGIQPGNVVEFSGQEGSGKTEMLLHLIANCILPKSWKDLELNGRSVGVVFVNTDYHFQLLRLVTIIEHRILTAIKVSQSVTMSTEKSKVNHLDHNTSQQHNSCYPEKYSDYETFIKTCLGHLYIVNCNSSLQMLATILSLENLLSAKPEVGIFMIDSLSAFYWVDRYNGGERLVYQESNQRKIVDAITRYAQQYHVVLIVTKQAIFGSTEKATRHDYLCQSWQKLVNFRYEFDRRKLQNGMDLMYSVFRTYPPSNKLKQFYIKESGIEFVL